MKQNNYTNDVKKIRENMRCANELMTKGCDQISKALMQLKNNDDKIEKLLSGFKV